MTSVDSITFLSTEILISILKLKTIWLKELAPQFQDCQNLLEL